MTFNLMGGSLVATLSSLLLTATGGYVAPFLLLLGLTVVALGLNLALRKPRCAGKRFAGAIPMDKD